MDQINFREGYSDLATLWRACAANADEDTPRLVFADCLAESGFTDVASFIRAQIDMAQHGDNNTTDFLNRNTASVLTAVSTLEAAEKFFRAGTALDATTMQTVVERVTTHNKGRKTSFVHREQTFWLYSATYHRGFMRSVAVPSQKVKDNKFMWELAQQQPFVGELTMYDRQPIIDNSGRWMWLRVDSFRRTSPMHTVPWHIFTFLKAGVEDYGMRFYVSLEEAMQDLAEATAKYAFHLLEKRYEVRAEAGPTSGDRPRSEVPAGSGAG